MDDGAASTRPSSDHCWRQGQKKRPNVDCSSGAAGRGFFRCASFSGDGAASVDEVVCGSGAAGRGFFRCASVGGGGGAGSVDEVVCGSADSPGASFTESSKFDSWARQR